MGGISHRCAACATFFQSGGALAHHNNTVHPIVPEVLNRADFFFNGRFILPPRSTYCGRGSKFGNPYHIGADGDRDQVIDRYIAERSVDVAFIELVRRQLKGRHLICHCRPLRCHCDWLLTVANAEVP